LFTQTKIQVPLGQNTKEVPCKINKICGAKHWRIVQAPFGHNAKGIPGKINKISGAKRRKVFFSSLLVKMQREPLAKATTFAARSAGTFTPLLGTTERKSVAKSTIYPALITGKLYTPLLGKMQRESLTTSKDFRGEALEKIRYLVGKMERESLARVTIFAARSAGNFSGPFRAKYKGNPLQN